MLLEELEECIPSSSNVEEEMESRELTEIITRFLEELSVTERSVFVRRYWNMDSIAQISEGFGFSESKTKTMLWRIREKLAQRLRQEGRMV